MKLEFSYLGRNCGSRWILGLGVDGVESVVFEVDVADGIVDLLVVEAVFLFGCC